MRILLLAALIVNLAGCATFTKSSEHKFDKTAEVNKPFDDAWAGVIRFFSSKNVSIKTIEKNSGLIVSEPFSINILTNADLFDCGKFSSADVIGNQLNGKASFNVFVEKLGAKKTKITLNTFAEINNMPGAYGGVVIDDKYKCYSTGSFEKMLFEYLK